MSAPDHPGNSGLRPSQSRLCYGFTLGGLRLLPAEGVLTEVVDDARIYPVPKAAAALVGVTTLRGNIVPVLDFAQSAQGAGQLRQVQHRVLVFDRGERSIAMLLDMTPELLTLVAPGLDVARPDSPLSEFLVRPWASDRESGQIWWEFNHRAAGESLLRRAGPEFPGEAIPAASDFNEEFA